MSPGYRWRCHKCELGNEPGRSTCAHCGFPAVASAFEIAAARGEPNPAVEGYCSFLKGVGWCPVLFPWIL